MSPSTRRVAIVLFVAACSHEPPGDPRLEDPGDGGPQSTRIRDENAKPGDPGWALDDFFAGGEELQVYARPLSVKGGERVTVQVSTPSATGVTWQLFRLGHYGGAGGRQLARGEANAAPQPAPALDPSTGLVECRWAPTFSIDINSDWLSGVYVARVALPDGSARLAPFIVRDERPADVALVMPTATDQAYNAWGGESLYIDSRYGLAGGHGHMVSYDRPAELAQGGGIFLYSAMPTARWLEANGWDVTYLADHDVARTPSPLGRVKVALALAHDEYWSKAMRDHWDEARDAGKTLGFLGANIGFWQVRFAPGADGTPDRRMIGYKEAADLDPEQGAELTGWFSDPRIGRPENALLGVLTAAWHVVDFPWVIRDPGDWIWRGAQLEAGTIVPSLVGIESDAPADNGRSPAGLRAIADSYTFGGDEAGFSLTQPAIYETAAGGAVLAASSIRFPSLVSGARAQRTAQLVVENLLRRGGARPATATLLPLGAEDGFTGVDTTGAAARVTLLAGRAGEAGFADGEGGAARLASPAGLALTPSGDALIVADTQNRRLRRVALEAPFAVTTIAGSGAVGDDDGPAAAASFRAPVGVAVASDGAIYVTDLKAKRIRVLRDGVVSTLAGPMGLTGPVGIALAPDGRSLVVADQPARVLRRIALDDGALSTLAVGSLGAVTGVAFDGGTLHVVDSSRHALRRVDGDTTVVLAGNADGGFTDGVGGAARLQPLLGLARVDDAFIVADTGNYRLRRVTPSGAVTTWVGGPTLRDATDDDATTTALAAPTGLAWDPTRRRLYVAETGRHTLRAILP